MHQQIQKSSSNVVFITLSFLKGNCTLKIYWYLLGVHYALLSDVHGTSEKCLAVITKAYCMYFLIHYLTVLLFAAIYSPSY
jgi:hypothetical protein